MEASTEAQIKMCLKSPCTSISASSAVLAVQGLLRQILHQHVCIATASQVTKQHNSTAKVAVAGVYGVVPVGYSSHSFSHPSQCQICRCAHSVDGKSLHLFRCTNLAVRFVMPLGLFRLSYYAYTEASFVFASDRS